MTPTISAAPVESAPPSPPSAPVARVLDGTKIVLFAGWFVSVISLLVAYKMFGSDMMLMTVFTGSITAFSAALFRDIK